MFHQLFGSHYSTFWLQGLAVHSGNMWRIFKVIYSCISSPIFLKTCTVSQISAAATNFEKFEFKQDHIILPRSTGQFDMRLILKKYKIWVASIKLNNGHLVKHVSCYIFAIISLSTTIIVSELWKKNIQIHLKLPRFTVVILGATYKIANKLFYMFMSERSC